MLLDNIRAQFDNAPYPRNPLEQSPQDDYNQLFIHSLVTPYYLRDRRVVSTHDKVILDAGCGTGYAALTLAIANPGAKIVGIDLSPESIKLARQRLEYHGFSNAEFHAMTIEDLPSLGLEFDYINCDEVLYLLPDTLGGLQAMNAVLKPTGIIRANLHNALQRDGFYRAQKVFQMLGLMDGSPGDAEIKAVVETMQALKPDVKLRGQTWRPEHALPEYEGNVMVNYLLLGDKGFSMTDLFELLDQTGLDFLSMVNWRHWQVPDLFQDSENLPAFWGMSLMAAAPRDQLRLYELLNPVNRLMDFWCTRAGADWITPVDQWDAADWQTATVHLHPQLQSDSIRAALVECLKTAQPFEFTRYIDLPAMGDVRLDAVSAGCLLPLWDAPQSVCDLVQRYLTLHPVDPVTLASISPDTAFATVTQLLNRLDAFLYVLIEAG